MLKERTEVSRRLTLGLAALEHQLDDALVMANELIIDAVRGRRTANLPLSAGQEGIDKVQETLASLNAARRALHEGHQAFRADRDRLRMPVTAYGDTGDTPDFAPTGKADHGPSLAVVGERAAA